MCSGACPSHCLWVTVRRLTGASLSYTLIHKSSTSSFHPLKLCPNDIFIFRSVCLCPERAIHFKFNNITRLLHVAPNPETESLPADLHPLLPQDHAYMVTVELHARHPILNKKCIFVKDTPPAQPHEGPKSKIEVKCVVHGHR